MLKIVCLLIIFLVKLIAIYSVTVMKDQNGLNNAVDGYDLFWNSSEPNALSLRNAYATTSLNFMNTSADPCNDFYNYACGNWEKYNPVLNEVEDHNTFAVNRNRLHFILRDILMAPDSPSLTDGELKAKKLFRSCMDNETRKQRGAEPALDILRTVKGWPPTEKNASGVTDWLNLTAHLELMSLGALFKDNIEIDLYDPSNYITVIDIDTLLFKEASVEHYDYSTTLFKSKIKDFLSSILRYYGLGRKNKSLTGLLNFVANFEKKLVNISKNTNPSKDHEHYEKWTIKDLQKELPAINLQKYLTIVQERFVSSSESIVVKNIAYMRALNRLLESTDDTKIVKYLLVRWAVGLFPYLDGRTSDQVYSVIYNSEPEWIDCLTQQQLDIRSALGALYVRKYFSHSKTDAASMIDDLKNAFKEIIYENDWLDNENKELITEKVSKMSTRIGYPDDLFQHVSEEYQSIKVDAEKYFESTIEILRHKKFLSQKNINKPLDVNYELLDPINTNAFYDAQNRNEMVYPASLLQPPFYNHNFPKWANFGGIGAIIGHEITHAFDMDNANIDANGNERVMELDTLVSIFVRTHCFIRQYNSFKFPNIKKSVDGNRTLSENLSDNTGVKIAFRAYKNWLKKHGNNVDTSENLQGIGLTYTQRFFISYAQNWCDATQPIMLISNIDHDEHAPDKYRVIGVLSNSPEFSEEFQCRLGSKMNPRRKCSYMR